MLGMCEDKKYQAVSVRAHSAGNYLASLIYHHVSHMHRGTAAPVLSSLFFLAGKQDLESSLSITLKSVNASRHIGLWILLIYILLHSAGRSKKKDKCKNTQMYPLSETQYCPCDKYNAQPVGNWSDCILPEGGRVESILGMKVQGDIKECGQGYRYQAMVCYDQDNRLVETLRCNSHGGYACMGVCQCRSVVPELVPFVKENLGKCAVQIT